VVVGSETRTPGAEEVSECRGGTRRVRRLAPLVVLVAILVGAVLLAGCAGQEQSGTPAVRVSTWVSGAGGGAAIGTIEVDSRNIDQALAHHNSAAAIKEVCALLTNDAETAIGQLPTPDNQLTDDLNNAYTDGAAAGDDCYKGAGGTASLLKRSAEERQKLVPLIATALDRIVALTGHTPSTSTTQPAGSQDPFGGDT
jgi:outer membrane murein-binding lipoprotein Lpp